MDTCEKVNDGTRRGKINLKFLTEYAKGYKYVRSDYKEDKKEMAKVEKEAIEKVNILKATQVFQYYENEIAFWQEMNLKKIREESTKEQCFE